MNRFPPNGKICDHSQWKKQLDQNKTGIIDLYTCQPSRENLPIATKIGSFFRDYAPQSLYDYSQWLEREYCDHANSLSEKGKNAMIVGLINRYGIPHYRALGCQTLTPDQCAQKFNTIDDFFTRELDPDFMISSPQEEFIWVRDQGFKSMNDIDNKIMISPAECYSTAFPTTDLAKKIYIKGKHYTTTKLLGIDHGQLYQNAMTLVFRLTLKHYHRFHNPINGLIIAISRLGAHHLSTQRELVNSPVDIYTENIRYVLYIETRYFGVIAMVIIGATCVTSVTYENPVLQSLFNEFPEDGSDHFKVLSTPISIKKHDLLGRFHYGGSTIVILIPPSPTNHLLTRVAEASEKNIETDIVVGQPLLFTNL